MMSFVSLTSEHGDTYMNFPKHLRIPLHIQESKTTFLQADSKSET